MQVCFLHGGGCAQNESTTRAVASGDPRRDAGPPCRRGERPDADRGGGCRAFGRGEDDDLPKLARQVGARARRGHDRRAASPLRRAGRRRQHARRAALFVNSVVTALSAPSFRPGDAGSRLRDRDRPGAGSGVPRARRRAPARAAPEGRRPRHRTRRPTSRHGCPRPARVPARTGLLPVAAQRAAARTAASATGSWTGFSRASRPRAIRRRPRKSRRQ
jgi:hypothetical protein